MRNDRITSVHTATQVILFLLKCTNRDQLLIKIPCHVDALALPQKVLLFSGMSLGMMSSMLFWFHIVTLSYRGRHRDHHSPNLHIQ